MKRLLAAALLAATIGRTAVAQDAEWVDVRFHRVFLLNGNFIDGKLVKDTPQAATLLMKSGEMTIRRDMIDRIEFVTIRTRNEKPKAIPAPTGPSTSRKPLPPKPAEPVPDTPLAMNATEVDKETREKVDDILSRMRKAPSDRKGELAGELSSLGVKAAIYLATNLEALDESTLSVVGSMLGRFSSPKVTEILAKMTLSPRPGVRAEAAAALGSSQDPAMSKVLQPLLRDTDTIIRGIAVESLVRLKAVDAVPEVARVCLDQDRSLRSRAMGGLQTLLTAAGRGGELRAVLFDLVRDAKGGSRADLLTQLGRDSKKEDWSAFARYVDDQEPGVRQTVALVLSNLSAPESAETILGRLSIEKDKWSRMYLAGAVLKLRAYKGIDDLLLWLSDKDPDVKAAAHQALRGLTNQAFDARPELWQNYWNSARAQFLK